MPFALEREHRGLAAPDTQQPAQPDMAEVVAAARAAWGARGVDAELATLAYDSLTDIDSARWRSARAGSTLIFDATSLSIVVDIRPDGLTGQFCPPGPESVTVEVADGRTLRAGAVHGGLFSMADLPGAPIRLRAARRGQPELLTSWFRLPAG